MRAADPGATWGTLTDITPCIAAAQSSEVVKTLEAGMPHDTLCNHRSPAAVELEYD